MGLYDQVTKGKKPRISDNARVAITIIVAAVITVSVVLFIITPLMHHRRYVDFMNNLSKDTALANRSGAATVMLDGGEPRKLTQDELYTLYKKLVLSEVYEENPEPSEGEPGIYVDYGNGSSLSLWPRQYEERIRPGVYLVYERTKGKGIRFATYMIQYDSLAYLLQQEE